MPLYEYKCDQCGEVYEVVQKVSDPPLKICSKCGGMVTKMLSSPAIQFKGSGWYVTDYVKTDKKEPSNDQKTEKEIKSGKENKKSVSKELSETSKKSTSS